MTWWTHLPIDEQSLYVGSAVLLVAVISVVVAVCYGRRQLRDSENLLRIAEEQLALERGRRDADQDDQVRPDFELTVDPAPHSGTNPRLSIRCIAGTQTYDVTAEILKDLGFPAAIALIGDDAQQLGEGAERPWVHRRYRLGLFRKGETRSYSVQPDPGIAFRKDDRAFLRLIATAKGGAVVGSAWQSTYPFHVLFAGDE